MEEPSLQCSPRPHQLRCLLSPAARGAAQASGADGISASGNHSLGTANIRSLLVAAPGCLLLSADYRQVELRMMAHFSGDEALCAMLADGQPDPFNLLAAKWLQKNCNEVTPRDREQAKQICYALSYGMGATKLGELLGVTAREAGSVRDSFLGVLPGVKAWMEAAKRACARTAAEGDTGIGYVEMLSGRRRWLPGITSRDNATRAQAERAAINTIMQGSASDVCKRAMVAIHRRLAALGPGAAALVLQIHDELLVEVEEGRVEQVAAVVRECMEVAAPAPLRVPLRVRVSVGRSWGELAEMADPHAAGQPVQGSQEASEVDEAPLGENGEDREAPLAEAAGNEEARLVGESEGGGVRG